MLLVTKENLTKDEFQRIEEKLAALSYPLRWKRRGDRLFLLVRRASKEGEDVASLREDPAIEYVLQNPTEREIARFFTRRELLDFALVSTGVLAGAALLGPLAVYLATPPGERSPRGMVPLGLADSIPIGGSQTRAVDGDEFLIIRRGEDRFHALTATCTHSQVCLVEWDRERRQVVCPCHRGIFDAEGNVVSGPPPRPLGRRDIVVRDGMLFMKRSPV